MDYRKLDISDQRLVVKALQDGLDSKELPGYLEMMRKRSSKPRRKSITKRWLRRQYAKAQAGGDHTALNGFRHWIYTRDDRGTKKVRLAEKILETADEKLRTKGPTAEVKVLFAGR